MSENQIRVVRTMQFITFYTFPYYELLELAKQFPGIPFRDIAFILKKREENPKKRDENGSIEIKAVHPLDANGHSRTTAYSWDQATSYLWKSMEETAATAFPGKRLEDVRFWLNPKPDELKLDITVDV